MGPTAFAATQQALGALEFLPKMATMQPVNALGDKAGCLKGGFLKASLKDLYLRHMRCACRISVGIQLELLHLEAEN